MIEKACQSDFTLLSFLDLATDRAKSIIQGLGEKDVNLIIGGYGATPIADQLLEEFPGITVIPNEASGDLPKALTDLKTKGKMEPKYEQPKTYSYQKFAEEPFMNDEIWKQIRKLFGTSLIKVTETTKGCCEGCYFCSTPTRIKNPTHKPLDILIHEIERMKIKPWEVLFFVDQNLLSYPHEQLLELFRYINKKKVHWGGEGIDPAMATGKLNEELYREMAKNCLYFLMGIEEIGNIVPGSPTKTALSDLNKLKVLVLKMKNDFHFPITYSLIFGSDQQEKGYGKKAAQFVLEHRMMTSPHILLPRPGTPIWDRKSSSLISSESDSRNMGTVIIPPAKMSVDEAKYEYLVFMNEYGF